MSTDNESLNDAGGEGQRPPFRRRFAHWPPITTAVIVACAVMAVIGRMQPQVTVELMFYPPFASYQPYRFLTSAILHGGFWHLVFNMYALWLLGRVLEPALGKIRFVTLYLVAAIGGNVTIMLLSNLTGKWDIGAVGASGAIFGLFGALAVLYKKVNANMTGIIGLLGVNVVLGFVVPGISWESHLGGLLTGALLTWLWIAIAEWLRDKWKTLHAVVDVGVGLAVLAAFYGLLQL